jgi:hypothetical protein
VLRDTAYITVRPHQRLPRAEAYYSATLDRVGSGVSLFRSSAVFYPNSTPGNIFDNLYEVDCLAEVKGLQGTIHLVWLELGSLVNHHTAR